jgi:DNA-binding NtrC family response regulator
MRSSTRYARPRQRKGPRDMASLLVIDDEPQVLSLLRKMLEQAGHTVHLAEDGRKGLKVLNDHDVDLVITDIFMPDVEGIELIRLLKREHPMVKIIAISGGGGLIGLDCLPIARKLGADNALAKPFSPDDITRAVADLLS